MVGDVEVVALGGELDMGTAPQLRALVGDAPVAEAGLVLDISGLAFLAPAGIRALLDARAVARRELRPFALVCRPDTPAYRTLRLTGTLGRMRLYRDPALAIAALTAT